MAAYKDMCGKCNSWATDLMLILETVYLWWNGQATFTNINVLRYFIPNGLDFMVGNRDFKAFQAKDYCDYL